MRVTGGQFVGRRLKVPKGPAIRTTLDHVRQALFHMVGGRVQGAKVLDLFAGSGVLGIEALSRGASHATFVDRSRFCMEAIEANLDCLFGPALSGASLGESLEELSPQSPTGTGEVSKSPKDTGEVPQGPTVTLLKADALAAIRKLARQGESFDLVFLDPPYGRHLARKSLIALVEYAIVSNFGLIVAEHDKRDPLPTLVEGKSARLVRQRHVRYGDTALSFYAA